MFDGNKLDEIMLNWKPRKFTNKRMVEELEKYDISLSENSIKAYRNCRADPGTKTLSAMGYILGVPVIDLLDDTSYQAKEIIKKYSASEGEITDKVKMLSDESKRAILLQIEFLLERESRE